MKHILVPFDGSEGPRKALHQALDLGRKFGSKITVLTVAMELSLVNMEHITDITFEKVTTVDLEANKMMLQDLEKEISEYPYEKCFEHTVGNIAKEIIGFAEENNVDLIVMGSRGLGAVSRTFLGSISHKVLNNTIVSVMIIK